MAASIIALDVGFKFTGLVIATPRPQEYEGMDATVLELRSHVIRVEDCPSYSTRKTNVRVASRDFEGCRWMYKQGFSWIQNANLNVEGVVLELPSAGAQGARANRCMGMATGVAAAFAEEFSAPIEVYLPEDCTLACLGKRQVPRVMRGVYAKGRHKGQPRMVSDKKAEVRRSMLRRFVFNFETRGPRNESEGEHVYDAASALVAARHGNIVRSAGWDDRWFEERFNGSSQDEKQTGVPVHVHSDGVR